METGEYFMTEQERKYNKLKEKMESQDLHRESKLSAQNSKFVAPGV
jgi:hypothetical protein